MPNIDTTAIEGFDSMTDGEKLAALLSLEIPEQVDLSGYIKKDLYDKTASELAAAKKSLKEKMSADETAKTQADEERAELENKYNELLKKSTISDYTAKYLELGYAPELARSTAEAIFDGDMDKVFENQQKFNVARDKEREREIERKLHPNGGGKNNADDSEELRIAKELGRKNSETQKSAMDGLKHYIK
ncbi:MAG: hypothetical protein ACI35R_08355 [Bacillus sp. (in: firmicutes)]